jgi:cytochrome P450
VEGQVQEIVSSHGSDRSDAYESRTIFHDILDGKLSDSDKTIDRLTDEGFVLVVAGGETTARVLSALIFFLLSNPEWLEKVHEELDGAMHDPRVLSTWQKLEALPVLVSLQSILVGGAVAHSV